MYNIDKIFFQCNVSMTCMMNSLEPSKFVRIIYNNIFKTHENNRLHRLFLNFRQGIRVCRKDLVQGLQQCHEEAEELNASELFEMLVSIPCHI